MATRYFCDHCGKPLSCHSQIRQFYYGLYNSPPPSQASQAQVQYAQTQAQGLGGGGFTVLSQTPLPPYNPLSFVDLCPVCADIWPKRVAALCVAKTDVPSA